MNRLKEFIKRRFDKGFEKYFSDHQEEYDVTVAGYRGYGLGYSEAKEKAYKELKAIYFFRCVLVAAALIFILFYFFKTVLPI